ncbi:MAG: hypothetical protein JO001_00215 [Alphaproteobacteria bacterium]|nr:hypothetical protein [Alphaproteobacteria bacterium]
MRILFEGGYPNWVSQGLTVAQRREYVAVLAAINDGERSLERLRSQLTALDGPAPTLDFLHGLLGDSTGKIPAADIWAALGKPVERNRLQRDNDELGRAMRRLGWTRTMKRFDGPPRSAYVKGSKEERRRALYLVQCPATGEWEALGVNDI